MNRIPPRDKDMISSKPMAMVAMLVLAVGCVTDAVEVSPGSGKGTVAQRNRENLERLSPGMSWDEVTQIMGHGQSRDEVDTPHKVESVLIDGGVGIRSVIAAFYVTEDHGFNTVVEDELTPLLFWDDTLVSWGEEARKQFTWYQELDEDRHSGGPLAFGEVVLVYDDELTIVLSGDSPVLTDPGPSFAVYRDDKYKGEAVVVEIRGQVLSCRIGQHQVKFEVGDSAATYLR